MITSIKKQETLLNPSLFMKSGGMTVPSEVVASTRLLRGSGWGLLDISCISKLTPTALLVLGHVAVCSYKSTYFFQSHGYIADVIGRSDRSVRRAMVELARYGLLRSHGRLNRNTLWRTTNTYVVHPELYAPDVLLFLEKNYPEMGLNSALLGIVRIERLDRPFEQNVLTYEYKRNNKPKLNNKITLVRARVGIKIQGFRVSNEAFAPGVLELKEKIGLTADQAVQFEQFPTSVIEQALSEFLTKRDVKKPFEWCLSRSRTLCRERRITPDSKRVEYLRKAWSLKPHPESTPAQLEAQEKRNAQLLTQDLAVFHSSAVIGHKPSFKPAITNVQRMNAKELAMINLKKELAVGPTQAALDFLDKQCGVMEERLLKRQLSCFMWALSMTDQEKVMAYYALKSSHGNEGDCV